MQKERQGCRLRSRRKVKLEELVGKEAKLHERGVIDEMSALQMPKHDYFF